MSQDSSPMPPVQSQMRQPRRMIWILAATLLFTGGQARQAWEQSRLEKAHNKAIPPSEFARIFKEFSEPGGYFRSDNFVSNETSYLHIVDKLKELGASGGAYIGVGPEQNFTYIAKIRPQIAFIVDIRRQAVIQHLMFKALFQLAETRTRFLSLLFSKPIVGAGPGADASAQELVSYFSRIATDGATFTRNLALIGTTITRNFAVPLDATDRAKLEYVYSAFRDENFNLQYRGYGRYGGYGYGSRSAWSYFPTLGDLMLESDLHGKLGNFLASRNDYEFVRSLQISNRIIPIVGDFGGTKAIAAVASYLKKNGYAVTAFYTSNVEQYLFDGGEFDEFAKNVGLLPITARSLFIRAYPNQGRSPHPAQIGNHRLTTLLQKISVFLDDYQHGLYTDYWTLVRTHYISALPP
ncbi:MAG: hypothetical protein LAP85_01290 [Acidobacteriia bacterium]|nr:hypothetical protein [Terriglobia bacterium]